MGQVVVGFGPGNVKFFPSPAPFFRKFPMPDSVDKYFNEEIEKIKPTVLARLQKILREDLKGSFRYNLFTNDIEHAQDNTIFSPTAHYGTMVNDSDTSCLRGYLTRRMNFSP